MEDITLATEPSSHTVYYHCSLAAADAVRGPFANTGPCEPAVAARTTSAFSPSSRCPGKSGIVVYDIEFTASGPFDVVITTSGEPSAHELEAGRRRLFADPHFRRGMNVLVDHSHLDAGALSSETVRKLADSAERDWMASGLGCLAVVAPASIMFGLSRMWEALAARTFEQRVAVFRSSAEELEWIDRVSDSRSEE